MKKNPKQNKRIFRENKFQEKRERELHLLKKWNDDICDIFPYDTFYRLETKVTKNKTKKTYRKKIGFNNQIYQTPSVTTSTTTTTPFLEVQIFSLVN